MGVVRAHGGIGAFVSKWIINKSTLQVLSGSDLMQQVYNWDAGTQSINETTSTISFGRFCSADLPPVSAFYNAATGLGTKARIYMNGEESNPTGYQVGSVASGSGCRQSVYTWQVKSDYQWFGLNRSWQLRKYIGQSFLPRTKPLSSAPTMAVQESWLMQYRYT
ncbi:MAG: hypothetical protein WDO16_06045 [Bacteroidota bacterium]